MMLLTEEVPGTHPTISICGNSFICTFNVDTLISSAIALVLTIALGLAIAYTLRRRTPHRLQMLFELFLSYVRGLTHETVAPDADFVMPLAATIGFFILLANWLDFFPLQSPVEPANADFNLTLAMGVVVIIIVQWYAVHVLGWRRYFRRFTKPFEMNIAIRILFVPLNLIEEFIKPVTLALRLFGNVFAGLLMVYLLSILFVAWAAGGSVITVALSPLAIVGLVGWKLFDVFFIGSIQAFIFMLLTIIYFGLAREGLEEDVHHGGALPPGRELEEAPG